MDPEPWAYLERELKAQEARDAGRNRKHSEDQRNDSAPGDNTHDRRSGKPQEARLFKTRYHIPELYAEQIPEAFEEPSHPRRNAHTGLRVCRDYMYHVLRGMGPLLEIQAAYRRSKLAKGSVYHRCVITPDDEHYLMAHPDPSVLRTDIRIPQVF